MGKKIKVLMVEPIGGLAGSERVLLDVLSNFRDNDELIFGIFTPESGGFRGKIPNSRNIKIFPHAIGYLHEKSIFSKILNFSLLFLITIIFRPHIIHINQAGIYKHTGIIARIFKIPQIVHVRIIEDALRLESKDINRFNIKKILVNSKFTHSKLDDYLKNFTEIIYSPYIPRGIRKPKRKPEYIGCVGRITPVKKQHLFISAAKEILRGDPSIRLLIYGNIDDIAYFRQLIKVAGKFWNRGIIYAGFREPEDIFKTIDILIHTAENEPLGRVVIESISSGIPVVVPNSGGTYEIVKLVGGGLIFEANSVGNLVEKTGILMKGYDKFLRRTEVAKKKIEEIFSIGKYVKRVSEIYKEMI